MPLLLLIYHCLSHFWQDFMMCIVARVMPINNINGLLRNKRLAIKEMGLKVTCFVGFFYPSKKNLPIEKSYNDS